MVYRGISQHIHSDNGLENLYVKFFLSNEVLKTYVFFLGK